MEPRGASIPPLDARREAHVRPAAVIASAATTTTLAVTSAARGPRLRPFHSRGGTIRHAAGGVTTAPRVRPELRIVAIEVRRADTRPATVRMRLDSGRARPARRRLVLLRRRRLVVGVEARV